MHDELGQMWKEPVVAYFKILSQNFLWVSEEYHDRAQPNSHPLTQESNQGLSIHSVMTLG
jgi:hypothetical protein